MTLHHSLIVGLWIAFVAYWGIAAIDTKRSLGTRTWWRDGGPRSGIALVTVLILLALRIPAVSRAARVVSPFAAGDGVLADAVGVALCALGMGFAVWARIHLGRNWGLPMSRKANPELVTTGPYALVRHPIYTGWLLAMLGSAVAETAVWLLPLILCGGYFLHSARREERFMAERFPQDYPAYRRRTKMLVPFLL